MQKNIIDRAYLFQASQSAFQFTKDTDPRFLPSWLAPSCYHLFSGEFLILTVDGPRVMAWNDWIVCSPIKQLHYYTAEAFAQAFFVIPEQI